MKHLLLALPLLLGCQQSTEDSPFFTKKHKDEYVFTDSNGLAIHRFWTPEQGTVYYPVPPKCNCSAHGTGQQPPVEQAIHREHNTPKNTTRKTVAAVRITPSYGGGYEALDARGKVIAVDMSSADLRHTLLSMGHSDIEFVIDASK